MLWLASLMGIVGAGAASLVLPQAQTDEDETNHDDDHLGHADEFESSGDLLSFEYDDDQTSDEVASPFYLHEDFMAQEFAASSDPHFVNPDETHGSTQESLAEDPFAASFGEDSSQDEMSMMQAAPVALGDWIMAGQSAEVLEYEAETESLMLVWDDLADDAHEPDVRVEQDPDDTEVMHVVMNDYSVAEVHGDPSLSTEDVTVIPLSSALIVGLEPA